MSKAMVVEQGDGKHRLYGCGNRKASLRQPQ